jgi:hypothetical protein
MEKVGSKVNIIGDNDKNEDRFSCDQCQECSLSDDDSLNERVSMDSAFIREMNKTKIVKYEEKSPTNQEIFTDLDQ